MMHRMMAGLLDPVPKDGPPDGDYRGRTTGELRLDCTQKPAGVVDDDSGTPDPTREGQGTC